MHEPKRLPTSTKKKLVTQSQPITIPQHSKEEEMELLLNADHTDVQKTPLTTLHLLTAVQESLSLDTVVPTEQSKVSLNVKSHLQV